MRRLLSVSNLAPIIVGIFIFLGPWTGFLANSISIEQTVALLIEKATGEDLDDYDLDDIEFTEDKSNVYLTVLNYLSVQKQEVINQKMAREFNIDPQEIQDLVELAKLPPKYKFEPAYARARYDQIAAASETLQKQKLEIFAREIFANNDTDDSPFDLIQDLDRIESILFATRSEVMLSGTSQPDKLPSAGLTTTPLSSTTPTPTTPRPDSQDQPDQSDPQTPDSQDQPEQEPQVQAPVSPSPEPNECSTDSNLEDQLNDFEQSQATNSQTQGSSTGSDQNPDSGPSSPPATGGTTPNTSAPGGGGSQANNSGEPSAQPATRLMDVPDVNEVACPDDSIFCIVKEEVLGTWGLVIPSNLSCVQCQVDLFNQYMKDLLSNNLLAKKVTGNFAEFPFCKASLKKTVVGIDFAIISKSIRDPYPIKQATVASVEPTPPPAEVATKTQSDTAVEDPQKARLQEALDQANKEASEFEKQIKDIQEGYQDIGNRIDTFNTLLVSLKDAFAGLKQATDNLTKKEVCE